MCPIGLYSEHENPINRAGHLTLSATKNVVLAHMVSLTQRTLNFHV